MEPFKTKLLTPEEAGISLVQTHKHSERHSSEAHGGKRVQVTVAAARRRSGGLAIYPDGTGPFYTNRADRRQRPTGDERRAAMKQAERAARRAA